MKAAWAEAFSSRLSGELYARYSIFACVHCSWCGGGNKALSLSRNNVPLSIRAWNNWLQPSARIGIIDHVCDVCPDIDIESLFNTDEWLPLDGTVEIFFSSPFFPFFFFSIPETEISPHDCGVCSVSEQGNRALDLHRAYYRFDTTSTAFCHSTPASARPKRTDLRKLSAFDLPYSSILPRDLDWISSVNERRFCFNVNFWYNGITWSTISLNIRELCRPEIFFFFR